MSEQMNPQQAVIRFAELLNAFRSTLAAPEQELLDQLVDGAQVEVDVESHAFKLRHMPAQRVPTRYDSAAALAAAAAKEPDDIEDVEAHAFAQTGRIPTWSFKASNGVIAAERLPAEGAADPGF